MFQIKTGLSDGDLELFVKGTKYWKEMEIKVIDRLSEEAFTEYEND